ncbi:MAG: hypothetical protein ABI882_07330 [Acidobacteriota bacterium]
MFEPEETDKMTAKRRSQAILLIAGVGALVLAVLVVLVRQALISGASAGSGLENAVRAGSSEFDAYREKLIFEDKEIIVHPNMIGMAQYEVRSKLTNRGDRAISGIELQGKILDLQEKVIAQNTSMPIPRLRKTPLAPGETMRISVKVDAPRKVSEAEVKDVTLELRGLRFQ